MISDPENRIISIAERPARRPSMIGSSIIFRIWIVILRIWLFTRSIRLLRTPTTISRHNIAENLNWNCPDFGDASCSVFFYHANEKYACEKEMSRTSETAKKGYEHNNNLNTDLYINSWVSKISNYCFIVVDYIIC